MNGPIRVVKSAVIEVLNEEDLFDYPNRKKIERSNGKLMAAYDAGQHIEEPTDVEYAELVLSEIALEIPLLPDGMEDPLSGIAAAMKTVNKRRAKSKIKKANRPKAGHDKTDEKTLRGEK